MSNLMDYVNSSLEGISDSDLLYKFKSGLIADLTERANEITHAGLGDKDLIDEIVISEHPDIRGEFLDYKKALAQKRAKKSAFRKKIVASILFIILMVTVYLLISIIKITELRRPVAVIRRAGCCSGLSGPVVYSIRSSGAHQTVGISVFGIQEKESTEDSYK